MAKTDNGGRKNLKPIKKGEVRNPLGAGSPGHIKRRAMLESLVMDKTTAKDANGVEREMTQMEAMSSALINRAKRGDVKAYQIIMERMDGKSPIIQDDGTVQVTPVVINITPLTHDDNGNPLQ